MKETKFFSASCVVCGYLANYLTLESVNYRALCDSCGEKRVRRLYASDVDAKHKRGDLHDAERRGKRTGRAALAALRTHAELKEIHAATLAGANAARKASGAALNDSHARELKHAERKRDVLQGNANFLMCVWKELDAQATVYANALEAARAVRRLGLKPRDFRAVRFGVKDFGDGCGVAFYVFPARRPIDKTCHADKCACGEAISDAEAIQASGFEAYDGGAGREFARRPTVYRAGSRVIVSQSYGVDV